MSLFDDRMQTRGADKAQALGEVAAVLARIDAEHRDPGTWERLCLLRAFSHISAGCYLIAVIETRDAMLDPNANLEDLPTEPVIQRLDLPTLFAALKEAMGEDARLYPHVGPMALG